MSDTATSNRTPDAIVKAACADAIAALRDIDLPDDLQIPTLPRALTEFIEATSQPDFNIPALGKIVEQDPGMTVDLLRYVNTAAYGATRPVMTPRDAMVRLGVPRARNFLIAAGIRTTTLSYDSRLMNHKNFWTESLRRAVFAQAVAKKLKTDADLAFIGGLLQDFVLPVLTNQYDNQYIDFLKTVAPQGVSLTEWEWDTFGWDHAAAGAYIARKWKMPDDLLCAIFLHHRMELALQAPGKGLFQVFPITLSAFLPDQLCQVPGGAQKLIAADKRSDYFQLDSLASAVDDEMRSHTQGDDSSFSLAAIIEQARQAGSSSE